MAAKARLNKPIMILLYGFPGSGKSTFARQLSEGLDCAHIHSDRIRFELFEEPRRDKQEEEIITHLMDYMAEEFLAAGVSVIYDAITMRKSQRMRLRELARKKHVDSLIIWFQMDPVTAFDRLKNRDKRKIDDKYATEYTPYDFKRYAANMQHPQNEEFVVISGKHTFSSQKSAVFKKLLELGFISPIEANAKLGKPGMVNLVPRQLAGRVDMARRDINIR